MGEGGVGSGGVDQQKAALKLLNTPTIASNCVALHFYYNCTTIPLHQIELLKLLNTPTNASNCVLRSANERMSKNTFNDLCTLRHS